MRLVESERVVGTGQILRVVYSVSKLEVAHEVGALAPELAVAATSELKELVLLVLRLQIVVQVGKRGLVPGREAYVVLEEELEVHVGRRLHVEASAGVVHFSDAAEVLVHLLVCVLEDVVYDVAGRLDVLKLTVLLNHLQVGVFEDLLLVSFHFRRVLSVCFTNVRPNALQILRL